MPTRTAKKKPDDLATLRRLRLDRDLSYAQLGDLIGLRRQTLFRLLNEADARPNDRTRYKIAKFLSARRTA